MEAKAEFNRVLDNILLDAPKPKPFVENPEQQYIIEDANEMLRNWPKGN